MKSQMKRCKCCKKYKCIDQITFIKKKQIVTQYKDNVISISPQDGGPYSFVIGRILQKI